MKKCPSCDLSIDENIETCPNCGLTNPFSDVEATIPTQEQEAAKTIKDMNKPGGIRKNIVGLVICLVVVILIGGYFLLTPSLNKKPVIAKPMQEQPSAEFTANLEIITKESLKVAAFDVKSNDFNPVYDSAMAIVEPSHNLKSYVKDHPKVTGGAEALVIDANTWNIIDLLIGGQEKQVAESYYLLIDLYPTHEKVSDAKRWLRLNGFQVSN